MAVERVKDFFTLLAGVCPFAVKPGVKVYLDESLKRHAEVLPGSWLWKNTPTTRPGWT